MNKSPTNLALGSVLVLLLLPTNAVAAPKTNNPIVVGNVIQLHSISREMRDVAIVDPDGQFLVVADEGIRCNGITIASDGKIFLDIRQTRGVRWGSDGLAYTQYVFHKTGKYRIIVTDNLETELENSMSLSFYVKLSISRPTASQQGNSCSLG